MASEERGKADPVGALESLREEPCKFNFFQALRLIECAFGEKPRIGSSLRIADDPVRLGQEPSMAFSPSSLASFKPGDDGRPWRLDVFFLGLFGPNGPLPLHLTEYARDRLRNYDDPAFARFADIFHHRMLSLFYRAWASAQPAVNFDRPESDRFSVYMGALIGLGMPSLRNREPLPDLAKFHHAGLLSSCVRSAAGLESLLEGYFDMPVSVKEFMGEWVVIAEDDRLRLGGSRETASLGETATLGGRVWSCQQKFRIEMGPLGFEEYKRMASGGTSMERLVSLVRSYVGDELTWDVELALKKEEVPFMRLGQNIRLGQTAWCISRTPAKDLNDLRMNPLEHAA